MKHSVMYLFLSFLSLGMMVSAEVTQEQLGQPYIAVSDGKMSAQVKEQSLTAIFEILAQQIPLQVYWKTSFGKTLASKKIFAQFRNQPIIEGVKILLSDTNHIIKGVGTKNSPMEIWLLPDADVASPTALATVPQITSLTNDQDDVIDWSDISPEKLRQLALTSKRGEVPERALLHLGEYQETPENRQILLQSLQDQSLAVRRTALDELNTLDNVPLQPIATIALQEPDVDLQRAALAVLVHKFGKGAQPTLENIQEQARPEVRMYASQLLQYLKDKY